VISAYTIYVTGWLTTDLNEVAVYKRWGRSTGKVFGPGTRWYAPWPFESCVNVPDRSKRLDITMDGERINAQDGAPIYFGLEEGGGTRNELQYSVVNPILRIAVANLPKALRSEYLEVARLVIGQAAAAVGAKNEKTLFNDYIVLPADIKPGDPQFEEFKLRLETAMFIRRDRDTVDEKQPTRLYKDDSVKAIMEKAGTFMRKTAAWGIGDFGPFTPNIRENPATEVASTKKQVAIEEMEAYNTTAGAVTTKTKELIAAGVSPDFAATLAAKLQGQDVKIENETKTYSGIPEAMVKLGDKLIDTFAPKQ
jgi:hypothetical protein